MYFSDTFVALVPDDEMGYLIAHRFGIDSYVMRKYERMMFWLPKFRHANPYPLPYHLPTDPKELAKIALNRMAVDVNSKVTLWKVCLK